MYSNQVFFSILSVYSPNLCLSLGNMLETFSILSHNIGLFLKRNRKPYTMHAIVLFIMYGARQNTTFGNKSWLSWVSTQY
jgi:hypothetical protein